MKQSAISLRLNSLRSRLMLLVALAILPLAIMTVIGGMREREQAVPAAMPCWPTSSTATKAM